MDQSIERAELEVGAVVLAREPTSRLGPLRIEPALLRVRHDDGREEILQPRIMQVLAVLLRARGEILTRDELILGCWNGLVVGEDAINRVLSRLRRLSEGIGKGCFQIETIARVGYRLLAADADARTAQPAGPAAPHPEAPGARRPVVCVLPFANISGEPGQDYFSDGITEDIITDLAKVSALSVISRHTAFALKGRQLEARQLARELGVSHVLEGSVRKAGERVRIAAQLTDGAQDAHLWAERWDRDFTDIFALQDEIAHSVVEALKLRLLPEEKTAITLRGASSAEAHDLYLKARQHYGGGAHRSRVSYETSVRLCRRAAELDPGHARAWALMALAQAWLRHIHGEPGEEGLAAAERALALDPGLAEAHAAHARHLGESERYEEAFAAIEKALSLDPASHEASEAAGLLSLRQEKLDEAIAHYEAATELAPTDFGSPGVLSGLYGAAGDAEGARRAAHTSLARAEAALEQDPGNGGALGFVVAALATLGEAERARAWVEHALKIDPDNPNMRYNFACAMVALDDVETALELLGPLFAEISAGFVRHAKADPDLAPLREDPRFNAMLSEAEARLAAAEAASALIVDREPYGGVL
jgi:adenylate cyclase